MPDHKRQPSDRVVLLITILLLLSGIAFVYSASAEFALTRLGDTEELVLKHATRAALSLVLLVVISRIDYHILEQLSRPLLVLSIVLLLFVLLSGTQLKGAARWLDIAGISFQPSELAKFALLFHLAVRMTQLDVALWDWRRGLLPLLGWIFTVCALIALQPNLSTALLVFGLAMMLLTIGGARLGHLIATVSLGAIVAGVYAVGADYRLQRLAQYLGKENGSVESYQLQQALIGYAHGGLFGVGPGCSRQRDLFLPESYGDFIAAIIGEEYGTVGIILLMVAYGALIVRGAAIARRATDTLGFLLAWAVTLVIGWYALVNLAVSCGVLPTTGIPLPLVSYGGTSILFTAAAIGILLNISKHGNSADA
ncbi:MAG: putative lipid II flippase FtsW [Chlorobi bacterium]|nr:putative lipid II flippase FtsW [Chlorobiota bacterium]